MITALIQILCAALGTLGFALFFHVRPCHLLVATLGGALSWLVYLLVGQAGGGVLVNTLVAAMAVCLWSETMARLRKAPANVFLIPGIVPLLPGGAFYYAMQGVVLNDMEEFTRKGSEAAFIALGIAGGILVASEIVRLVLGAQYRRRQALRRRAARLESTQEQDKKDGEN
jgi:uncharacterized membrane protein YjjB (DUF3815 family)